jgi:hypothetical protein
MKIQYSILIILPVTILLVSLLIFSSTNNKLGYALEEGSQTEIQETINLTLGKPIYTEKFTVPKSSDDRNDNNLTKSIYSFSGNGTLNDIKVSSTGNGLMVPREDGTYAITDGRALFTSKNGGNASYSFESIINIKDNVTRNLGAAFFDANATGNLEFLNSVVGVYKAVLDEKGTFNMWQIK